MPRLVSGAERRAGREPENTGAEELLFPNKREVKKNTPKKGCGWWFTTKRGANEEDEYEKSS